MELVSTLTNHPVRYAVIFTLFFSAINFLTHLLFSSFHIVSLNYIISVGLYGTLLFPLYYVLTFVSFFLCIINLNSKNKPIFIFIFILYAIFSLPIINIDSFKFNH